MAGDESNGLKALLILTATELLGGQKIAGHSLPEVVALLKQEYLIHRGNATRYRDLVTTEAQGHEKTKRALTEEQAGHATEREAHTATCTEYEAAQGGYEAAHTEFEEARGAWEQERSGLEGTNSGLEAAVAARDKTIEELQDTLRTTNANANTTRELLNYMTEAHQRAGEQLADIYELLTGESAPDKGDLDVTSLVTALDTDDTPTLTPLMAAYTQLAEQEGNVIERMGELQGRLDTLEENLTQALENAEGQESAQRTALKKASERAEGLAATVDCYFSKSSCRIASKPV
jgi:chromosome segregation ATPase